MQQEIMLLIERLVVAVEGISDNVSKIWISLNEMNANVSYSGIEKRCTDITDVPLSPITIKETSIATTDVPPATCLNAKAVYIGSANSCLFGDQDDHDIGEYAEKENEKSLHVQDKTSIDTHISPSICSINVEGRHDTTSLRKSFHPTVKEEPIDLEGDWSLGLESSCGNTGTVIDTEEESSIQIINLPSVSNVTHNPPSINNPGSSNKEGELISSKYTLTMSNRSSIKKVSCFKESTKPEEKDKESFGNASCSLMYEQFRREVGVESASLASATTHIGTEKGRECVENKEDQRNVQEAASSRKDGGRSSFLETPSSHDEGQVKRKKSFCCETCGKCFQASRFLERHKFVHTGEKRFKCSVCNKAFSEKGNLAQHLRIHTGARPFSCSVCGMTFRYISNVKVHMRHHTGDMPFTCHVCKKSFPQKHSLDLHMHSHTGERPFKCSLCGKDFAWRGSLSTHMRVHNT